MEVTEPLLQIPVTKVVHIKLTVISILVVNSNQLVIFSTVKWIEKVMALVMRESLKLLLTSNFKPVVIFISEYSN